MRKLLMFCTLAFVVSVLQAQTSPRSRTQSDAAPRSSSPAATPAKSRTNLNPTTSGASELQPAGKSRSTGNTPSGTQPAARPATNSTEPNPTATAPGSTTSKTTKPTGTARTVPAQMPAAPPLQQNEPVVKVQWMSLEEALEKSKTEKRKIFIDVYTDWCGWCKRMDESTFVDPEIAEYLNENYYPVKFNAEQQEDIQFNDKVYHFRKNGARGYHELAAEWLNNRLSFPTVVFLDESTHLIQSIPTYLEATKLEVILNYFGTDSHKTTPWETYERKFNSNQQR